MRFVIAAALAFATVQACAQTRDVVWLDANTNIRHDARLRTVVGTDTAAAGASHSMEARHRAEMKAGAGGPDDEAAPAKKKPAAKKKPPR